MQHATRSPNMKGCMAPCAKVQFHPGLGFVGLAALMMRSPVNACRRHARNEPVVKRGSSSENHRIDETKQPDPGERPGGAQEGRDCATTIAHRVGEGFSRPSRTR